MKSPPVVVADTGPLIAFAKLERLDLLTVLFSTIHIPQVVLNEATCNFARKDARLIESFASSTGKIHPDIHNRLCSRFRALLDEGETQALVLARKLGCGVLMDEKRGRQVARHHRIPVVGVLGVLLQAKRQGQIKHLKPLVEQLQESGYRLSTELVTAVLRTAEES